MEMQPTVSVGTNAAPPVIAAPSQPANEPVMPIRTNTPAAQSATNAVQTLEQAKWKKQMRQISARKTTFRLFLGRLVDQFENPVTDAQIDATVQIYNGVQSTVDHFSVTSDENGFFKINHGKGESLGLAPHKDGYTLASTDTLFKYSHLEKHPYVSDQNNPTVIKMWKLQGAEPLIDIGKEYKIPYTSQPIYFDLVKKENRSQRWRLENYRKSTRWYYFRAAPTKLGR